MKLILCTMIIVVVVSPVVVGAYSMTRPNTKIFPTQCTGTGNKDAGVDVTFQLKKKSNGAIIKAGQYSDPYTGWMVSLTYSNVGVGVGVDADLIANGTVQVHKDVTTAIPED